VIKLRPYQQQAVSAACKAKRGIIVAPAGSGKTIIAAEVVKRLAEQMTNAQVSWIAHTQEQVQQGKDALAMVAPGIDAQVACYAAQPDLTGEDIIIVDECHHAGADGLREMLACVHPSAIVLGFTATPIRADGIDITDIIGPILYTVDRQEIQAVGGVLPAVVRVVEFGKRAELEDEAEARAGSHYTNGMRWRDMQTGSTEMWNRCVYRAALQLGIRDNARRDLLVAMLAKRHMQDSVIVLVDSKDHGKRLQSLIMGSEFVASGTRGRAALLEQFRRGEIRCVICTSLVEEGFDAPIAGVIILAGSGKSHRKTVQSTGRVLRPYQGKPHGIIYDICDLGHGMLKAQHWGRRRVYKSLRYKVEMVGL
jgi:superfamily II DNA or RNA helicase